MRRCQGIRQSLSVEGLLIFESTLKDYSGVFGLFNQTLPQLFVLFQTGSHTNRVLRGLNS